MQPYRWLCMRAADPHSTTPSGAARRELWGRYMVYGELASGGMATVEFGRLLGPLGFARPVAIKRMHPHFARDPDLVAMFIDEARLSARLNHANVIPALDIVHEAGELALVMEYVPGESLADLLEVASRRGAQFPIRIAASIAAAMLHGLHAAHEARDDRGDALGIVHRDVSPQNVLIGVDGVPRVFDFGIAKATGRLRSTPDGQVKGKLAYIAPEQLRGDAVDRRTDVYGASSVLWEMLCGRALFDGPNQSAILHAVLTQQVAAPSTLRADASPALDRIVLSGLSRDPEARFSSAREMALALERQVGACTQSELSAWLESLAGERIAARAARLHDWVERPASPAATPARREPSRRWLLGAAFCTAALFALLAFTWWRPADAFLARPVPRAPGPPGRSEPLVPASRPAPASPDDRAGVEASPALGLPSAVAAELPRAPVPPAVEPREPSPRRSSAAAPRRAAERSMRDARQCAPPYVVDAIGVRHPKPECL